MTTQTLGHYQLLKKLATGGMAEVWLARQTGIEGFNRHVVVKRILPHLAEDREFVEMFLNEARIAARLSHPNIGQIYELGEHHGQYFIAMEFIRGEDLGRIMRRAWASGQWVASSVALRIIADACQGLYYAHSRTDDAGRPLNIVHRDISPQNILVSFDGTVKVVDFGIAKAADSVSNTKSGAIKGKFAYMAPEQAQGKPLDSRTDLFALGLVLYELLTSTRPLKKDSEIATLQAAMECAIEPPSVIAEVPADLDPVVMRALAKAADERYRDGRQFQLAIEEFLVQQRMVATSVQVSQLMEALFADRLAEEARLGAPSPATESSISNPVASPSVPAPPQDPRATADDGDDEDEATLGPEHGEPPSVGGFELPAGTVLPSRRYLKGAPAGPRGPKQEPPRASQELDDGPTLEPPRRRTGQLATPSPNLTGATIEDLQPAPAKPRRTGAGLKRRPTAQQGMPDAPARKSKLGEPAVKRPTASDAGISKYVDVQGLEALNRSRLKRVGAVLAVGVLAGLGLVFKDPLFTAMTRSSLSEGKVPVLLSVTTNPHTHVAVLPPAAARDRPPLDLGETPLDRVSGAYVGDTVVLTNRDRGIRYEEVIAFGQANDTHPIEKVFKEATLKVRTRPALRGATIWRGANKVGQVGLAMKVFEGVQQLEVRSEDLAQPVEFEVRLRGGAVLEQDVDVSASIERRSGG